MSSRESAPIGAPCWADLWTSDVDGARSFYSQLFGWEALEPNPEFGGYFQFTHRGAPVAGGMGDMGDQKATNTWSIYLATDDAEKTAELTESAGGTIISPPMAVADLGTQLVITDPTGAHVGAWQPGTFPGFTALGEHGAPSWFELHTRDYAGAVSFYRDVFRWETQEIGNTDEFRYSVMRDPSGEGELAGIMDSSAFLPAGKPAYWALYWEVDDAEASIEKVTELGGSLEAGVDETPYGRLARVVDPFGARFSLRQAPPAGSHEG